MRRPNQIFGGTVKPVVRGKERDRRRWALADGLVLSATVVIIQEDNYVPMPASTDREPYMPPQRGGWRRLEI
jgi:hypothetical protein